MQSEPIGIDSKGAFSNLIDLRLFFENMSNYVIIKLPEHFPNYNDYEDIDILCEDTECICTHILTVGQQYISQGFEIKVHQENKHFHVDVYCPGSERLNFRFDLLSSLDVYRKIAVDPLYHKIVLASKQQVEQNFITVFIPSLEHELAIRFIEYWEWKNEIPSKIKHLHYIHKKNTLTFVPLVNKYTNLFITVDEQEKESLNVFYKSNTACLLGSTDLQNYYQLDSTCQIPGLAGIYEDFFGKRADGCFVEFGAFDGEYVSNTSGLADIGWTGYYIEPVPDFFEKCCLRHRSNPNTTVHCAAIGAERAVIEIHVAGPLSTSSSNMKQNFAQLDWSCNLFANSQTVKATQVTLEDYLSANNILPGFELIVVDVEGLEWDVFKNFDLQKWHPQMVIIELHDQNDDYLMIRDQCLNLVNYFDQNNYVPIYKDTTNTIYVQKGLLKQRRMRMDYFLIWGNGIHYTNDIIGMLRNDPNFEILAIHKKNVGDIEHFVPAIYACDTVPYAHLIEKTRYLAKTSPEIIFILVRNNDPQERYFGIEPFRHIQSQTIKILKEEIRNRFNPRLNGKRTEEHVVHASDYESQVDHALQMLDLPPLEYYKNEPNPDLEAPYHLGKINHYEIKEVNITSLCASILDRGLLCISETPHYSYVAGMKSDYTQYHQKYFGTKLTDDHFPEVFDDMIHNFHYETKPATGKHNLIVAQQMPDGNYKILDGVHRASILSYRGVKRVRIAVVTAGNQTSDPSSSRPLFVHDTAQNFEKNFTQSWLQNNFHEKYGIIKCSVDTFMSSGILSIGRQQTLVEFFQGKQELWQKFIDQVIDKKCLEIGSGPCGFTNYWHFIRDWHVIDPLADEYKQMIMGIFGKTWWWPWINTHSHCAEKMIPELVGQIDGVIVCRNALDHVEDPIEVLNNIARYAAPGCKLLLWNDLYHVNGVDEGHRNICRSKNLFRLMITNRGFIIEYETPAFRNGETIEFGCVAIKAEE